VIPAASNFILQIRFQSQHRTVFHDTKNSELLV
jgi:hypothetical protein